MHTRKEFVGTHNGLVGTVKYVHVFWSARSRVYELNITCKTYNNYEEKVTLAILLPSS